MTTRPLLIAVLLAGGCAGADYVYTKAGATAEQRETDKTDCLVDARTTAKES
jgi:F0F1-type ATP synthase assembly protein I